MIKLICDKCRSPIPDPKKAFIFSAEKSGVQTTNWSLDRQSFPEYEYCAADNVIFTSDMHHINNLYCSKCAMTLWKVIQKFAEDSEYLMEDKN